MYRLLVPILGLGLPGLAHGQPVSGFYVGAASGLNAMPTQLFSATLHQSALVSPAGRTLAPASNDTLQSHNDFYTGGAAVAGFGYGFGNGIRLGLEANYRFNGQKSGMVRPGVDVREQKFGAVANVFYDFDIGSAWVFPYLGAGGGYMRVDRAYGPSQVQGPAYQGLAGAAFPLPWIAGLSLTLEYRFLGLVDVSGSGYRPATASTPAVAATASYDNDMNHSLLIGLRYAFGVAAPLPPPAPVFATPAAPAPARTYLVFFDWDRADLTDRARQIIAEAAAASTHVQTTRIEVQGNADRSGTPAYNQGLSLRRAQTVAAELVSHGVAQSAIDIQAFGDTRPLVPTAAGVREPQNRRVAIILR